MSEAGGGGSVAPDPSTIADRSRVLGALAYIPFLCFLPYFIAPEDEFARFHGRQGCALLILLVVLGATLRVFEWALGPIPVIGIVVITLARLSFGLTMLLIAVAGALKALLGERWSIPGLGKLADRVPI